MVQFINIELTDAVKEIIQLPRVTKQQLTDFIERFLDELGKANFVFSSKEAFDLSKPYLRKVASCWKATKQTSVLTKALQSCLTDILKQSEPLRLNENRTNVVLIGGSTGSGIKTTCAKYAFYHLKIGYKPALVCACAGFNKLKTMALEARTEDAKSGVTVCGIEGSTDFVRGAMDGVRKFKGEGYNLIILATCGKWLLKQIYEATMAVVVVHEHSIASTSTKRI
ncbi:hypothetical protein OROGR_026964 [Orobanche gracilis]